MTEREAWWFWPAGTMLYGAWMVVIGVICVPATGPFAGVIVAFLGLCAFGAGVINFFLAEPGPAPAKLEG